MCSYQQDQDHGALVDVVCINPCSLPKPASANNKQHSVHQRILACDWLLDMFRLDPLLFNSHVTYFSLSLQSFPNAQVTMIGNGIPVNTQTGIQSDKQAERTLYRQAGAQSDGQTDEHTPADADEHPLAEFIGGVGEDDGRVEVTTFTKHPEEVGHVEVVVRRSHHSAPHLRGRGSRHKVSGDITAQAVT